MTPIHAKMLELARSLRPGSAERQIILRATQQGMANLLKTSVKTPETPAPPRKPTVLPPKPPVTPGVMHIIRQADGGPAPAALTAMIATEAYVEAGAAPSRTAPASDQRADPVVPDRAFVSDGSRPFDIRHQASLGDVQLPNALTATGSDKARSGKGGPGGGDRQEAAPVERIAVQAIVGAVLVVAALVLILAVAR